MDREVLPWHWSDPDKLNADYRYLCEFYERALKSVAEQLNQVHNVAKETRYWRILIGPWLARFIHTLFDRWSSIHQAVAQYDIVGTIVRTGQEEIFAPTDLQQLGLQMAGDEWNHHIYAAILEEATTVPRIARPNASVERTPRAAKIGLTRRLATYYTWFASRLVRDDDALLIGTYLPTFDDWRLQFRLGQFPQFWQWQPVGFVPIDQRLRSWKLERQGLRGFESFLLSTVPKHMPATFLEGYGQLSAAVEDLPWPKCPKVIFTSNALWHDTLSMAYTAEKVTDGTPLVYGQHGGMSGDVRFNFGEEHEVAISDCYLSWGWDDPSRPKVKPLGLLKAPRDVRLVTNSTGNLLLVTYDAPRYSSRLFSGVLALTDSYYEDCILFAEALPELIRKELLVRLTSYDHGRGQTARWADRLPGVARDPGRLRMNDLLRDARLVVYSYNSTGHLEAFARNIPAVLFWDPKANPLRDSAAPYFEDLKRVGVLHDTPEAAARHVASVWGDVNAWWTSPPVREALRRFKERFCRLPASPVDEIASALNSVCARAVDGQPTPAADASRRAGDSSSEGLF